MQEELANKEGEEAAANYLSGWLKKHPSLRGLNQLIEYHLRYSDEKNRSNGYLDLRQYPLLWPSYL